MRVVLCFLMVMGVIGGLGLKSAAATSGLALGVGSEKAEDVNPREGFDPEVARERDRGKQGESGGCVIPKPSEEDIKTVLDYVRTSLTGASAPEDLDIRLLFQKDKVLLNLVREGKSKPDGRDESFPFHWRLPGSCKGEVTWESTLLPDAPAWARAIHSQGFARGLPIRPRTIVAFAGDSYEPSPGRGVGGGAHEGSGAEGTGNSIWLVGVLVGMGCVVLRGFL